MVFETDKMEESMARAFSKSEIMEAFCGFIAASMQGYAIVDTGATKSMSGIDLLLYCQDSLQQRTGQDVILVDPEAT